MLEPLTIAASKAAEVLAPELVKRSAEVGVPDTGTPAERGMCDAYARFIAGLLVEVARVW